MTEDEHAEAWKTRITAAAQAPAYDPDQVKALATLPPNYVIVDLARRFGGEARFDGSFVATPYRLGTRPVGMTVTNVRLMRDRIRADLEFSTITVASRTSTPVQFETDDGPAPDEDRISALTDWTFVL